MRTNEVRHPSGELQAFEVSNLMGVSGAVRILERIDGVRIIDRIRIFRGLRHEEIRVRFEYQGERFTVEEPYGDNSMFWIGPETREPSPHLGPILEAFARARWWGFGTTAAAP